MTTELPSQTTRPVNTMDAFAMAVAGVPANTPVLSVEEGPNGTRFLGQNGQPVPMSGGPK